MSAPATNELDTAERHWNLFASAAVTSPLRVGINRFLREIPQFHILCPSPRERISSLLPRSQWYRLAGQTVSMLCNIYTSALISHRLYIHIQNKGASIKRQPAKRLSSTSRISRPRVACKQTKTCIAARLHPFVRCGRGGQCKLARANRSLSLSHLMAVITMRIDGGLGRRSPNGGNNGPNCRDSGTSKATRRDA
jgi:hypothetical protein